MADGIASLLNTFAKMPSPGQRTQESLDAVAGAILKNEFARKNAESQSKLDTEKALAVAKFKRENPTQMEKLADFVTIAKFGEAFGIPINELTGEFFKQEALGKDVVKGDKQDKQQTLRQYGSLTEPSGQTNIQDAKQDLFTTEFKPERNKFTGETDLVPPTIKSSEGLRREKAIGESAKVSGGQFKGFIKNIAEFSRVRTSGQGMIANAKSAVIELRGFTAKKQIPHRIRAKLQDLGLEDASIKEQFIGLSGFEGMAEEFIISLSPILTQQGRILRGVLAMLRKTIPDLPLGGTTEGKFTGKLRQTTKNAFRIAMSLGKQLTSDDELQSLAELGLPEDASENVIADRMSDLLEDVKFDAEDEKEFSNIWLDMLETPPLPIVESPEQFRLFKEGDLEKQIERRFGSVTGQPDQEQYGVQNIKAITEIKQ